MPFELKTINQANEIILQLGNLVKELDAEDIIKMIHQYNLAEASSVVFDAIHFEKGFYEGSRERFWDSVTFKKKFLEKLEPLVRFLNEEEAKFKQEMEAL